MQELKIYIADLGAYNAGKLNGFWYELGSESNQVLQNKINVMLGGGGSWAIHDYELPFKIDEYQSVSRLNEWAERFNGLTEYEQIIQLAYIDQYNFDAEIEYNLNGQVIEGDTSELGRYIAEMYEIPEYIKMYVDYEQMGEDQYAVDWFEFEFDGKLYQVRLEN